MRLVFAACILLGCTTTARAEGVKLRMAAIAPEGTAWARELQALGRDVETSTGGTVRMRWYLGGVAGTELEALARVRAGKLDGLAGALFCQQIAPSLQAARVTGVILGRDEHRYVMSRLRARLDAELDAQGFVNLGIGGFGNDIVFSRTPIRTFAELKQARLWIWSLDQVWLRALPAIGLHPQPLPVEEAARAYDEGKIDGFIAMPTAALAYQWSARARYFTELPIGYLPGCVVLSKSAFHALPVSAQQQVRAAVAKFIFRFEDMGRAQDAQLLGGLFEKQGLVRVPPSEKLIQDLNDAARRVRDSGIDGLPAGLVNDVLGYLADWRAQERELK